MALQYVTYWMKNNVWNTLCHEIQTPWTLGTSESSPWSSAAVIRSYYNYSMWKDWKDTFQG